MSNKKERLKEIFENTIESGIIYDGSIENLDYFNMICKATTKDQLYKMMGNNLCMFNCSYEGSDSVIMIFSIPINSQDVGAKNIAERVMEVIESVEKCFITLDLIKSEEVKEEKFVYVKVIKKVGG